MNPNEKVLCIKNEDLKPFIQSGKNHFPLKDLSKIESLPYLFIERQIAEIDNTKKQIIPYCLITCKDQIAVYQRKGSEKRLHGKFSCGFGGHVNIEDSKESNLVKILYTSLKRELEEEINISVTNDCTLLGIIFEDETEVGKVHLGVVFYYEIEDKQSVTLSDEIQSLEWQYLNDTHNQNLETWSFLAINLLMEK